MISDIHFDHTKCDRNLLKKHLDEAVERDAIILINGDLFCIMQGKNDRRGSKSDLRPEYMVKDYFGAVVQDAVAFFAPYAKNLAFVGYGNHETAVIKNNEIDVLSQFCSLMKYQHDSPVQLGDYTGFINLRFRYGTGVKAFVIYYHHGYGGGGVVTRGVIQNQRKDAQIEGVDCVWMGHVHELYHLITVKDVYERNYQRITSRIVHHIRTSTYKQESSGQGWHEERGAPQKPLGGYWLSATLRRDVDIRSVEPKFTMAM